MTLYQTVTLPITITDPLPDFQGHPRYFWSRISKKTVLLADKVTIAPVIQNHIYVKSHIPVSMKKNQKQIARI